MEVSRTFVKWFLATFLLVILANIITPFFGVGSIYYLGILMLYFIFLFFLIYRKQDNGLIKFFKLLVLLVPVIILGYVFYANFVASHDFNYFYDIGGVKDANRAYLGPLNRVSDIDNETSSRNITSGLVYFDVNIPRDSANISVQIRVLDNFPKKGTLLIGGKNDTAWSYYSRTVFDQKINNNTSSKWIVLNTSFNLKDLYIQNGKLNMLIWVKHLGQNATQNHTIPIDWINLTIHKDGLFEKYH